MPRAERAFTLFEVLAAVAILGLLYTTLISWAMDGLLAEGTSKRRLEASLIADRHLADIELGIDGGVAPPLGDQELEIGDYLVAISVEPYDLLLPELAVEGETPGPLLADLTSDKATPLRRIEVRVSWLEAALEFDVVRTSFALDTTNLDISLLEPTEEPEPDVAPEQGE